jgi:hypothetical protein
MNATALTTALTTARRCVECIIPQMCPRITAPMSEWTFVDGGALMYTVEKAINYLHDESGAVSCVIEVNGQSYTVTIDGRVTEVAS